MKLYICEKPSQGEDVAQFLGMSPVHKKQSIITLFEGLNDVFRWLH